MIFFPLLLSLPPLHSFYGKKIYGCDNMIIFVCGRFAFNIVRLFIYLQKQKAATPTAAVGVTL